MPRDYKHRAQSRRHRQPSPVAWFVAGFLAGAAGTGLVWLKWGHGPGAPVSARAMPPAQPPQSGTDKAPQQRPTGAPPPRFEYYAVLPEMEVVIPPEELRPKKTPAPPPPPTLVPDLPGRPPDATVASTPGERSPAVYLLQLGSFRTTGDADRLKANLALLGIMARVEKVTIDDKGTYYRVRSGPYTKEQAYGLHNRLEQKRVESLILRSRG
jgi:cell division protein FtsN